MATREQIETLLEQLEKAPPSKHFQHIDENTVGIRAILKYLSETNEKITAGKISGQLKVSTARVAVLLQKMEAKDLIEKNKDPDDGRIVVVKLSEHGKQTAQAAKREIYRSIGEMIDKVGMDRMLEFAAISNEIHSIMEKSEIDAPI